MNLGANAVKRYGVYVLSASIGLCKINRGEAKGTCVKGYEEQKE